MHAAVTPTGQELLVNATAVVDLVSREAIRAIGPKQVAVMADALGQIAGINPASA